MQSIINIIIAATIASVQVNTEKLKIMQYKAIIKEFEGLHHNDTIYCGYGHLITKKSDTLQSAIDLLNLDLLKNIKFFNYSNDSIILGVLAYNVGVGRVVRSGLDTNFSIFRYMNFCYFRGKFHEKLFERRKKELEIYLKK